jgi:hypothetical protein
LNSNGNTKQRETNRATPSVVKPPNIQTRGRFALYCSVVLNAQHRTVQEGISVNSSWADEALIASTFYEKIGDKDKKGYQDIRTLASQKGFVEWGRRDLSAPGRPVIKVKGRDDRSKGLSLETYVRLTYSGLLVLRPDASTTKGTDWTMVLPRHHSAEIPRHTRNERSGNSLFAPTSESSGDGKLFVGGLAWRTTEDSLRAYFKPFGPLKSVAVMEGRGYGFVSFQMAEDATRCLKKAGRHIVDDANVE